MYFNDPRMQQRVPSKKVSWGSMPPNPLASSRLRRSIAKFQFFFRKPNPMPDIYIKAFSNAYSWLSLVNLLKYIYV